MSTDHWYFRPLGPAHRNQLDFPAQVADHLRGLAQSAHPRETGGLLLGWWEAGMPHVHSAVEVSDPDAGRTHWTRHEQAAAHALETALARSAEPGLGYVGEWHSHPANVGPSSVDLRELRTISKQYPHPLVLAVVRRQGTIETRIASRGRLTTHQRIANRAGHHNRSRPDADPLARAGEPDVL